LDVQKDKRAAPRVVGHAYAESHAIRMGKGLARVRGVWPRAHDARVGAARRASILLCIFYKMNFFGAAAAMT
jgi:hypothetical protein